MACRNIGVLNPPAPSAPPATANMRASHSPSKVGSSGSTSTGPKPCVPPRSWTPSTPASSHRNPERAGRIGGILPESGPGCWPQMPIAPEDVPYLRETEKKLNAMLTGQAAANGAKYVDAYAASIGHDACQPPGFALGRAGRADDTGGARALESVRHAGLLGGDPGADERARLTRRTASVLETAPFLTDTSLVPPQGVARSDDRRVVCCLQSTGSVRVGRRSST